jgi:RNA polymerase sigma-70 factor (ECF subfamily)
MDQVNADKLREADPEALGALIDELLPRLLRAAAFYSRDKAEAEDVVMEVFQHLLLDPVRLAELARTDALQGWCMRLTRNIAVHHARRTTRRAAYEAMESPEAQADDGPSVSPAMQKQILEALDSLDESTRTIVTLRYFEGLSIPDIAERLGLSPGAVRVRTYRAIRQLRQRVWKDAAAGRE